MACGRYAYMVQEHNGSKRMCTREERDRLILQDRVWDWKRIIVPAAWSRGF